ncbi:glutathione S-transferase family protein [Marinomonas shanghaiensis]|uniref:glutathione S-transferase family protein n=1 Tax=Marinomonas shanghaiensis TaxID=2202418 RepID=UPI003A927D70
MIRLYDYELSGSCYKVRLLLNMLSLDYEKVAIDFVGAEHKSNDFLALNPLGELPLLDDSGLLIRDAQTILVYLATKYDVTHTLYPVDAASQSQVLQWLAIAGNELMSVSGARLAKSLHYPLDIERLQEKAKRFFVLLDQHLCQHKYLALEHLTIADIACFPYSVLANEAGIDISGYKHLITWIERIKSAPNFIGMPGVK